MRSTVMSPSWLGARRKQSEDFRSVPSLPSRTGGGRRWPRYSLFVILVAGILVLVVTQHDRFSSSTLVHPDLSHTPPPSLPLKPEPKPKVGQYHPSRVLKGPPTDRFRDNLLPDVQYITGWIGGGHTNDFMTYINYIYLGLLTNRVPILGPFAPTHVGFAEDLIPFGDIYDVERLAAEIRFPVIEWRDVKKLPGNNPPPEPIGGWTVWARYDTIRTGLPRGNRMTESLGLEVSYTNTPERLKLVKEEPRDAHVSFLEVARLSTASVREEALRTEQRFKSEGPLGHELPPDEHLMVIDFSYFMGMLTNWEWELEYFEPWRIASHAHFNPKMQSLAVDYLMRHFEVETPDAIPKFIIIHARHGDFGDKCEGRPLFEECFASMDVMNVRVQEVRNELAGRPEFQNPDGSPINLPVLMTSDERDPAWWELVRGMGWQWIDHGPQGEDTSTKFGKWYPLLIDAVMQSMAHGFVGTTQSTMSIIAARRVEAWQHGATRLFRFGYKGVDDHPPQLKSYRTIPNNRFY